MGSSHSSILILPRGIGISLLAHNKLFNTFRRTLVTFRICEWLRLPQEVNAIQDYVVGAEAKSTWLLHCGIWSQWSWAWDADRENPPDGLVLTSQGSPPAGGGPVLTNQGSPLACCGLNIELMNNSWKFNTDALPQKLVKRDACLMSSPHSQEGCKDWQR